MKEIGLIVTNKTAERTGATRLPNLCVHESSDTWHRLSAEVTLEHRRFVGASTFEILRAVASNSGGYLPLTDIRELCEARQVKYTTIRAHLKLCEKKGLITKILDGYQWRSERSLHEELVGRSWKYLGDNSVLIRFSELISFLGKSRKEFSKWVLVNITLRDLSDLQYSAAEGLDKMAYKASKGTLVNMKGKPASLVEIQARKDHYSSREFAFEGSALSGDLRNANTNERLVVKAKRKKITNKNSSGDRIGLVTGELLPHRDNAVCSISFGVPCGVSMHGEAISYTRDHNITSLYSGFPISKDNIYFAPEDRARRVKPFTDESLAEFAKSGGFLDNTAFLTTVKEANASLSMLSRITGWSSATLSRYLKEPHDNMLVRDHVLVISKYCPQLTNAINIHYDQSNLPIRGRFYARRVSAKALAKMLGRGVEVEWSNINGSVDEVKKAPMFTVLVFQRAYFVFKSQAIVVGEKIPTPVRGKSFESKEKRTNFSYK